MQNNKALLVGLLVGLFLGCQKSAPPRTPVARVDDEILTLEQVAARFDTTRGLSQAQVHDFVQQWMVNELLYREAIRRGFDKNEEIQVRLQDIRRQLAINALLEQEVYGSKTDESSQEEIRSHYESNKDHFVLSTDVALISFVLFGNRDAANVFRTKVLRGTSWTEARLQTESDPQQAEHVVLHGDSSYYTEKTLIPIELWRVAAGINRMEPSFPIRTDEGFYVLIVWKLNRKGEFADLRYVSEEIRSRLAIERRQRLFSQFLENLRSKHNVQILTSSTDADSLSLVPNE